jgi:microcystin-dependent protein
MSEPFVGQVISVGFNFAPVGWVLCDGRILPISQYQALYTLLGTTYGGDGVNTFAVPDLRGRGAVGVGQGPGLQPYVQGQIAGSESITLTVSQIGAHTHTLAGASTATSNVPLSNAVLGTTDAENIYATAGATTTLAPSSVGVATGNNLPHENRQPFLAINYIIAVEGIFPTQS